MSLFITKINQASTQVSLDYLDGEHVWGLNVSATYEFDISDVQYDDGDDILLIGIDALDTAYGRKNIAAKIGVDEFVNGNVTSISHSTSNRVGRTTASISIEERKRVTDDGNLSDLAAALPSPQDVEAFSEDFNFTRDDNSYSYTRNISLKYKQDAGSQFFQKAYLFLKNVYLLNRPTYGFQTDGISENGRFNLGFKPIISESYDILNKEVKLTENFQSAQIYTQNAIPYSRSSTHSINLNANGYTDKSYSLEIKALSEPLEVNVFSGIHFSMQSVLDDNTGTYGTPFLIEKTINTDGGKANLSVNFSTDPRKNTTTRADYTAAKSREGSFDTYDFSLNISSRGKTYFESFNTTKEYWKTNNNIASTKIPLLFPDVTFSNLNEVNRNVSFDSFGGKISQSTKYTTNPAYKDNADGVLKRQISVSENKQKPRDSVVPIIGNKEMIIKTADAKTVGTKSVSVTLVSKEIDTIEVDALTLASGEPPTASFFYLTSQKSSLDALNGESTASITYSFFE